jgi:cell division protein FtsL
LEIVHLNDTIKHLRTENDICKNQIKYFTKQEEVIVKANKRIEALEENIQSMSFEKRKLQK